MRIKLITTTLLMVFLFALTTLSAQEKAVPAKPALKAVPGIELRQGMMQGRLGMLKNLNLTDEQKQKMQQIQFENQKEMIKIQSEIQLKRIEMKEIFAEKQVNTAKLSTLSEVMGKLELQIKKMKTDNWIKVNGILKDDQKEIWKKHFAREGFIKERARMGRGMMLQRSRKAMVNRQIGRQNMIQGRIGRGQGMMMREGIGRGRGMGQGVIHERMAKGQQMHQEKMLQNKKEEVIIEKK